MITGLGLGLEVGVVGIWLGVTMVGVVGVIGVKCYNGRVRSSRNNRCGVQHIHTHAQPADEDADDCFRWICSKYLSAMS